MDQSQLYELYDVDPGPIVEFLEHLRAVYRLPRPGSFLDMGCGPGRLLSPMAAAEWNVVGYEPDPDYARRAAETIRDLPGARFRQAGFLQLDEVAAFDLIAAVNAPYSYLLTPDQRREAVKRCARALRPGGVMFLEFSDFDWILKHYREPPQTEMQLDGTVVTRSPRHDIDHHQGTFTHRDVFTWRDSSGAEQRGDQDASDGHGLLSGASRFPPQSRVRGGPHLQQLRRPRPQRVDRKKGARVSTGTRIARGRFLTRNCCCAGSRGGLVSELFGLVSSARRGSLRCGLHK